MYSKFYFSQCKTFLSQFFDTFFKSEVMEYLIHYVRFEMWTTLFYVNYRLILNIET